MNAVLKEVTVSGIYPELFADFVESLDRGEATSKKYMQDLRTFWNFLQTSEPERDDIILYRESMNCSASTINQRLRTVKAFFSWTDDRGIYPNIAKDIRLPKLDNSTHKRDALTGAEVIDLEQSIAQHAQAKAQAGSESNKDSAGRTERATAQGLRDTAIIALAVNAGLRTVEISRLDCGDIERRGGKMYLWIMGKGHATKDTKTAVAAEVADALEAYLQTRDSKGAADPLFIGTSNRNQAGRLPADTVGRIIKTRLKESGIDSARITAHSLRHTCATETLEATGNNLRDAQLRLRHKDPQTTTIYLHDQDTERQADIAQIQWNHIHGIQNDTMAQLMQAAAQLTPEQLQALVITAQGMANR